MFPFFDFICFPLLLGNSSFDFPRLPFIYYFINKDKITEEPSKHSSTNPKKKTYSRNDGENKKTSNTNKTKKIN